MQETGRALQQSERAKTRGTIMLFGGPGHKAYLGCMSCPEQSIESIYNRYGDYGSSYGSNSIWSRYSDFGSKYSAYSACNPYASDPPVIVDGNGHYFGRLTINRYNSDRYGGEEVWKWLNYKVCGN